jgi:hypothetical protein
VYEWGKKWYLRASDNHLVIYVKTWSRKRLNVPWHNKPGLLRGSHNPQSTSTIERVLELIL